MTEKRFTLINWDNYAEGDCIYYDNGEEMGSLDVLDTLNKLNDENEQLHRINEENKEMIYSMGKELAKLRIIKKNLREIKTKWNWIMESVDYD